MILRSVDGIIRMLDADYIENDDIAKRIYGVCIDSRKVVEGNLYIPIKGVRNNGHHYIKQAIELFSIPISTTAIWVFSPMLKSVKGTPISLLKLPSVFWVT